jgi:hypothetical protein
MDLSESKIRRLSGVVDGTMELVERMEDEILFSINSQDENVFQAIRGEIALICGTLSVSLGQGDLRLDMEIYFHEGKLRCRIGNDEEDFHKIDLTECLRSKA